MRPLRPGARPQISRMIAGLAALAAASGLGGCSGDAERVYGYQRVYSETASFDTTGQPSRMSNAQQETLIAQAIVAHEMRRP